MSLPPSYNLLTKYPNRIGIDVGSYRGDSIQAFLDAGFEEVRSIDISIDQYLFCCDRFNLYDKHEPLQKRIKLYEGDSSKMLWEMIRDIQEPMTVFLDAHWQFFENEDPGANPFPLLKELEQIGRHPIRTHTLIVDDWHIFYRDRVGYSKNDVKNAILHINPAYRFTMAANPIIDGILIANI